MDVINVLFGGGVIIALLKIIMQNKEIYINNINSKRNESNNELRREASKIIAYCKQIEANINDENKRNIINNLDYEFYQAIAMVRMLLSLHPEREGNAGHDLLENKLKEIQNLRNIQNNSSEEIMFLTRQVLDFEWGRVKKEAKGNF